MKRVLDGLKPAKVFHFFEEITRIPRGSGNEKGISDYLVHFAKERSLEVIQDDYNNIIIKKNATKGYEKAPTIILQGHLDMVCEKNQATCHDFDNDPLKLEVDGDFVKAQGTTLGADNGIAVAYAMAILDSDDISHPALEVLLTTDEESGMSGAMNLKPEHINGRILINIDSEEEGELLVSCAGGLRSKVSLPIEWVQNTSDDKCCYIKVRGLKGGHSGMDIHKERANANIVLARVLLDLMRGIEFNVAAISGGSKNNAIPREADATILIKDDQISQVRTKVDEWNMILRNEYKNSDKEIRVEVDFNTNKIEKIFSKTTKDKAVKLLYVLPNGIYTMSTDIAGLVQSSTNLGVLTTKDDCIEYDSAVRSSIGSLKQDILYQTEVIADAFGALVTVSSQYPEWQYNPNSKIREVFQKVYKDMYHQEPKVVAIHAGVECGLFEEKFENIDMISFGPNMFDVHTPDERLSISSTERTWEYLLNILKEIR